MIDSIDLCKLVLRKIGPANQLKLQKLVYYIQAFHLVFYAGQPIIEDEFQAWVHGPVSIKIWHHYKDQSYIYSDIPRPKGKIDTRALSVEQDAFIDEVLRVYSPLTSYQLEMLTHSELPWIEARGSCRSDERCENTIRRDTMKKFYRELVESGV
ncbi:MAG: Panacea domain-containing protein [Syntrophobacteraceae bacterium]